MAASYKKVHPARHGMHITIKITLLCYLNVHSSAGDKLTPEYRHLLSLAEQLLYFNTGNALCQYQNDYSAVAAEPTLFGLILIPGPIVADTTTDLMY